MTDHTLERALGAAAVLGGLLRVVSAFIPWRPDSAPLELFYLVIDLALLFGLMGIYLAHRSRLGVLGFAGFVIAESGIASIVGPDTTSFGINGYAVGVVLIMSGLALLSIAMLVRREGSPWGPACWLGAIVVGGIGAAAGRADLGFAGGGIAFGLGFVVAGAALWRAHAAQPSN